MARDYKYRANQKKAKPQQIQQVAWWKWALISVLIILFISFLVYLQSSGSEIKQNQQSKPLTISKKRDKASTPNTATKSTEPRFDFYTILPEKEVVIPEYEISTRSREEQFGKGKVTQYIIQAGSFRDFSEADKLRARLALMGIESKVEKANVGNVVWNRVKMGPYNRSSSVSVIRKRLRQNGIDVIVTEVKG